MKMRNKFDLADPSDVNLPSIYKLALKRVNSLKLTKYQKFVLLGFDCEDWAERLNFIFEKTKDELVQWVNEQGVEDEEGYLLDNTGKRIPDSQ
jgi:hypothetical protein